MSDKRTFLDTNILVYAHDVSAGKKNEIAKYIVTDLWETKLGLISTQVLEEFFVVTTKKSRKRMKVDEARAVVESLLEWDVVVDDGDSILGAIDIMNKFKYSFWDSMVIKAAINGGAEVLLTEDFKDHSGLKGLTVENPFA